MEFLSLIYFVILYRSSARNQAPQAAAVRSQTTSAVMSQPTAAVPSQSTSAVMAQLIAATLAQPTAAATRFVKAYFTELDII